LSSKDPLRDNHFFEPNAGGRKAENPKLSHLLHMLLIQNFLDGEELDDSTRSFVERRAFLFGVAGVAEGDEEAALALLVLS